MAASGAMALFVRKQDLTSGEKAMATSTMKVTILGTRGEIDETAPYHSKKSGVLINDELLLDCGDERFLSYNPRYILITHLHPDHAFFVRSGHYKQISQPIYAPEPFKDEPISLTAAPFSLGKYHITPIPTIHSLKVKSNAYLIQYQGERFLYTGDMIWIEKEYHHLFGNLDFVITEASWMRKGGLVRRDNVTGAIFGHTGVPNLIALFKPHTSTMIFVHFGSWFYKDIKKARAQFKELAQKNDLTIIVGYDGLHLSF